MAPDTVPVDWLDDLLSTVEVPDVLVQPVQTGQPSFDFGPRLPPPSPIALPASAEIDGWKQDLDAALSGCESGCLIYPLPIPAVPRSLVWEMPPEDGERRRFLDEAAFLAAVLASCPPGGQVASLVSTGLLTRPETGRFRRWMAAWHRPLWIIYLGAAAGRAMGIGDRFAMTWLAVRTGPSAGTTRPSLAKLSDLRQLERGDWRRRLDAAATAKGGETADFIVVPTLKLDAEPWTYERFSRSFAVTRDDAGELGAMRPLGELTEHVRGGVTLKRLRQLGDSAGGDDELPWGAIRCYGARSLDGGELGRPHVVDAAGVGDDQRLAAGDVLIHLTASAATAEHPLAAVEVAASDLPATFERPLLAVRFESEVEPEVRRLLIGYLGSRHARDGLIAGGVAGSLTAEQLERLEVPFPRREVLDAFAELRDLEWRYSRWAVAARRERQELFDASSYAETLPALLRRVRQERERVQAAEESQSLGYKVRNFYPHAIALRRELLLQMPHGKDRVDATLDCAEHFLALLALLSMVQLAADHDVGWRPSSLVRGLAKGGMYFGWGKTSMLVRQAARHTAKHSNPLRLPFPEMASLAPATDGTDPPWMQAQELLHRWRNDLSHQHSHTPKRFREISAELGDGLDQMLEAAAFLAASPLVHVEDYELDPVTGERRATLVLRQGTSIAFRRRQLQVDAELPRRAVGVLDHQGTFRGLNPWLLLDCCPRCGQDEIFVFNRLEPEAAVYVALATGHPVQKPELAERWRQLVEQSQK